MCTSTSAVKAQGSPFPSSGGCVVGVTAREESSPPVPVAAAVLCPF